MALFKYFKPATLPQSSVSLVPAETLKVVNEEVNKQQ
jgi:hypothetical protein